MFILYADASGTADVRDVNSKHFVLLGICVHEGTWFALDKRFQGLKGKYSLPGQDFEIHAKDFAVDFPEQRLVPDFEKLPRLVRKARVQTIRDQKLAAAAGGKLANLRKKYKTSEPFIHLTRLERSKLLEDTLDLVGGHQGICLFGEAISKSHPSVLNGAIDPVRQAFEQVVSRFDAYLQRRNSWRSKYGTRPKVDNGLMILDQDYAHESAIERQFRTYRSFGHSWGDLKHVIDLPFFAASEKLSGLQLVDVCSYAVRRYLDTGAANGSPEESNFLRIFGRFDRDPGGRLHGLRHYVPAGACHCLVCHGRGHGVT